LIFVLMASHKQVFRLRESTTFRRLEFLLNSGPQKRPSRARETPTFRKNVKKRMSPRWHQLPQEPPLARFISETQTNVAPLCGQIRFFLAMPGRGLRPVITSALTNRNFLVKCRLLRAKHSLSRHYKTASAEIVVWPTPNTYFRAPSKSEFPSELEKPVRVVAATGIASGSLLGGPWQAEPRLLRNFANLYL